MSSIKALVVSSSARRGEIPRERRTGNHEAAGGTRWEGGEGGGGVKGASEEKEEN